MTNMALVASLSRYYEDSRRVRYWGYGWAAYVWRRRPSVTRAACTGCPTWSLAV